MSDHKKPRSDATLKTLPAERQAAIAEYARAHSLTDTRQWLAADGLKTSEAALSGWLSWFSLQQQLTRNEATVETLLTRLKREGNFTPEQIALAGQGFFTELALQQQDPRQWHLIQQTAIKKDQLSLDRQRFQRETVELFVKWNADQAAQEILRSNAPNTEKTERLGQKLFGDLWK